MRMTGVVSKDGLLSPEESNFEEKPFRVELELKSSTCILSTLYPVNTFNRNGNESSQRFSESSPKEETRST